MAVYVERIVSGKLQQNGFIVSNAAGQALIIDPGGSFESFCAFIDGNKLTPVGILNTHAHFDHIGAVDTLMKHYDLPFYLDRADARILRGANLFKHLFKSNQSIEIPEISHDLSGQDEPLEVAEFSITCIATPGHTPGGRCFLLAGVMFTGDTIFRNNIGRTDLYGGDRSTLEQSVRDVMKTSPETIIYPGHGQPSTIGEVKLTNPEVQEILTMDNARAS